MDVLLPGIRVAQPTLVTTIHPHLHGPRDVPPPRGGERATGPAWRSRHGRPGIGFGTRRRSPSLPMLLLTAALLALGGSSCERALSEPAVEYLPIDALDS